MTKRIYYNKASKKIVNEKGFITIEQEFTQVYDKFHEVTLRIDSSTSIRLLFWLLAIEVNKYNAFIYDGQMREAFCKYLRNNGRPCVHVSTFERSLKELKDARAIIQVGRGHYYCNPCLFWREGKKARESFIELEAEENNYINYSLGKQSEKIVVRPESASISNTLS